MNLIKILKAEHEKKWVALSKDLKKIVSFNESLSALKKNVGNTEVVYMKIPPSGVYLSF